MLGDIHDRVGKADVIHAGSSLGESITGIFTWVEQREKPEPQKLSTPEWFWSVSAMLFAAC